MRYRRSAGAAAEAAAEVVKETERGVRAVPTVNISIARRARIKVEYTLIEISPQSKNELCYPAGRIGDERNPVLLPSFGSLVF